MSVHMCKIAECGTAQDSSDNFPSYHPENHHCSDAVAYISGQG